MRTEKVAAGSIDTRPPETLTDDLVTATVQSDLASEWRDEIAARESGGQGNEWGTFALDSTGYALGRYQMRTGALIDAGMLRRLPRQPGGRQEYVWTGKYGVHSAREFLDNHPAQDAALNDAVSKWERNQFSRQVDDAVPDSPRTRDFVGRSILAYPVNAHDRYV